ncbi:MFS transporter [Actinomadura sp. LD22]|uniref:MFS transporter n=1 Tax=Actinomadura physcomitrii TaxID=2650748 RepID=A0A6I4MPX0_9ACTN|nr:MFS transporter [Actinomadura physcomitrii]
MRALTDGCEKYSEKAELIKAWGTVSADRTATFADLFRVGEYRALLIANLISNLGDQLARVSLALLVFDSSGSSFLTALTYALTLLPAMVGGPLLGGLADRYPRRDLLIASNLIRTILAAAMALPMLPLAAVYALVFALALLDAPERAARTALVRDLLSGDLYTLGVATNQLTYQVTLLAGFGAGAMVVTSIGPYSALAVNATTFACCALLLWTCLRPRPALPAAGRRSWRVELAETFRLIAGSPQLRAILALALLAGYFVVPVGLAVPYAAQIHLPTRLVGLLLAAVPAGNVVGMVVIGRLLRQRTRVTVMGPLAALAGLPLTACVLHPGATGSLTLFGLTGVAAAYQVIAQAEFVRAVPAHRRGQALGLAAPAITAVQGAGALLGGLLADHIGPAYTIALTGTAGLVTGIPLAIVWHRVRTSAPTVPGPDRDAADTPTARDPARGP